MKIRRHPTPASFSKDECDTIIYSLQHWEEYHRQAIPRRFKMGSLWARILEATASVVKRKPTTFSERERRVIFDALVHNGHYARYCGDLWEKILNATEGRIIESD